MFKNNTMWSDGDTFQDTMGIAHATGSAALDNKMNSHICYKGGGGGGAQTTTSGIPKEFRPYVERSLQKSEDAFNAGALQHVEGLTPEQQDAYDRKLELGQRGGVLDSIAQDSYQGQQANRDAAAGTGLFGAGALGEQTAALEESLAPTLDRLGAQQDFGTAQSGALGSARGDALKANALSGAATDAASRELSQRRSSAQSGANSLTQSGGQIQNQFGAGVKATEGVGGAIQQQKQNEADATYQGLQRIFGLYGSPAVGSESTTSSSGGGK